MITIEIYSGILIGVSTEKCTYTETEDSFELDKTGNKNTLFSIYIPFIHLMIIF